VTGAPVTPFDLGSDLPAPRTDDYSRAMRISEAELSRLSEAVVRAIVSGGFVIPKVDEKVLVARVIRLLLDDFRAEETLELEAEEMARKLGRQALGMDQRKIVEGIKARLAKERGFTL